MRLDEGTRKAIIQALSTNDRVELIPNRDGKIKVYRLKREEVKIEKTK